MAQFLVMRGLPHPTRIIMLGFAAQHQRQSEMAESARVMILQNTIRIIMRNADHANQVRLLTPMGMVAFVMIPENTGIG